MTGILTGHTESHLVDCNGALVHRDVAAPFQALAQAAKAAGMQLRIASGFRSFTRQLAIWNAKASGQRPVLNALGQPVDLSLLSDRDKVFAILRWSALPGASRHHWGTDMDVWDAAAVPQDYRLQLIPEEYGPTGPFYPLHCWLEEQISGGHTGFYRPYANDTGGIAPEPWHLSFKPLAEIFEQQLRPAVVRRVLTDADMLLKETALACLDEIFARFIYLEDNAGNGL